MERLENLVNMKYYTDSLKTIKIINIGVRRLD